MSSRWSDLDRPPLDGKGLNRSLLSPAGLWREIRVVEETGSTHDDLVELARAGESEGLVLLAEYQTAGRGRLGRSWTAPARSGLSFSLILRPTEIPTTRWSLLPLLIGVATATATASVADIDIGLKWPNDLMVGERKLGGVLAERVDSPIGPAVVIGVGLNVSLKADELPVDLAISLALVEAASTDRDIIARAVLRAIESQYTSWRLDGLDSAGAGLDGGAGRGHDSVGLSGAGESTLLPRYRELCVTLGRVVRAEMPGGTTIEGAAVDIDANGALVIATSNGRREVSAGEVVHLR